MTKHKMIASGLVRISGCNGVAKKARSDEAVSWESLDVTVFCSDLVAGIDDVEFSLGRS